MVISFSSPYLRPIASTLSALGRRGMIVLLVKMVLFMWAVVALAHYIQIVWCIVDCVDIIVNFYISEQRYNSVVKNFFMLMNSYSKVRP